MLTSKTIFLDASSFENVFVLNELFHQVTPVLSSLKSVDDLGAGGSRKRPYFWGQIDYIQYEALPIACYTQQ
jgi:hypothetical protein